MSCYAQLENISQAVVEQKQSGPDWTALQVQEEKRMAEAKLGHKAKAPSTRASLVQGKAKQTPPGQFSESREDAGLHCILVC